MTRRQLRESIFQALFRMEFNEAQEDRNEQLEFHIRELSEKERKDGALTAAQEADIAYIRQKVLNITEHMEELDAIIAEHTEGWSLQRIGKAELAILRLAVYEIRWDDEVPQGVAINEAVELTKRYCDEEAKGFVNAILGKLAT